MADQITGTTILLNRRYADLDLNFLRNPNTNDINILKDAAAVKRAIINLVLMRPGEAPFQPLLGCRIYRHLFEPSSPQTSFEIEQSIRDSIENFEPRAVVISVDANPTADQSGYDVTIVFTVINTQIPVTITLYMLRTR